MVYQYLKPSAETRMRNAVEDVTSAFGTASLNKGSSAALVGGLLEAAAEHKLIAQGLMTATSQSHLELGQHFPFDERHFGRAVGRAMDVINTYAKPVGTEVFADR